MNTIVIARGDIWHPICSPFTPGSGQFSALVVTWWQWGKRPPYRTAEPVGNGVPSCRVFDGLIATVEVGASAIDTAGSGPARAMPGGRDRRSDDATGWAIAATLRGPPRRAVTGE